MLTTGDGSKTVYVQFKDGAGNISSPAADNIILDTTPPLGAVSIEDGALYTTFTAVTLNLSAYDANGVVQMRFSNDGVDYSAWTPYANSFVWTLPAGDGLKTVYVQLMDSPGNVSSPLADSITLDTVPPTGSVSIEGGALYATASLVTLNLSASDANEVVQMRFSNDGVSYSNWEPYQASHSWQLLTGDGLKTIYAQFMDGAGWVSAPYTDNVILDTISPVGGLTIQEGAAVVTDTQVALAIFASDANGVSQMRLRNDTAPWGGWEPFATSRSWEIFLEQGEHLVWIQFQDQAGNISTVYSDAIIFQFPHSAYLPLVLREHP